MNPIAGSLLRATCVLFTKAENKDSNIPVSDNFTKSDGASMLAPQISTTELQPTENLQPTEIQSISITKFSSLTSKSKPNVQITSKTKATKLRNKLALYHLSDLGFNRHQKRYLKTVPLGVQGGGHVNVDGNLFSKSTQKRLDAHGVASGLFTDLNTSEGSSGITHIWLSKKDIYSMGLKIRSNPVPYMQW